MDSFQSTVIVGQDWSVVKRSAGPQLVNRLWALKSNSEQL